MSVQMTNAACSAIVGAIDDSQTDIAIGIEGAFFPQLAAGDWFYGTIYDTAQPTVTPEIVKVTDISLNGGTGGYDLVVERGAGIDGAAPKAWPDTAEFQLLVNSELLYDLMSEASANAETDSWIYHSITTGDDRTLLIDDENGFLVRAIPSLGEDLLITLPQIPPTGDHDFRYLIYKQGGAGDGDVVITPDFGQTVGESTELRIREDRGAYVVHAEAGSNNWTVTRSYNLTGDMVSGAVYGFDENYQLQPVVSEAPISGFAYVRKDGTWVLGVEEAPIDGNTYVRIDGMWQLENNSSRVAKRTSYTDPGSFTHVFESDKSWFEVYITGGGGGGYIAAEFGMGGGAGGTAILCAAIQTPSLDVVVGAGGIRGSNGNNSSVSDGFVNPYGEGGRVGRGATQTDGVLAWGRNGDTNIAGGLGEKGSGGERPTMGGASYWGGSSMNDSAGSPYQFGAYGCGGRCRTDEQEGLGGAHGIVVVVEHF